MRQANTRAGTPTRVSALHADRGLRAVEQTSETMYVHPSRAALQSAIEQLLADLRHLCDRYDLDYGLIDRAAAEAYYTDLASASPLAANDTREARVPQARDAGREEFLAGVIVTAVEKGIKHWARIVEYRCMPVERTLAIVRDCTDEASGRHHINLNRVERAIQQIVTPGADVIGGPVLHEIARGNMNSDPTEVGPEAADAIVQVAVFGKVVHH